MLNNELCSVESTSYNVHELLMLNGELCDVELTSYNIHEHMLEHNTQICVGKSSVNRMYAHH
jgi:hypothetical protein